MPNWCENIAVISHEDPQQIQRLVRAFQTTGLMQEFYPCPQDLLDTVSGAVSPADPRYAEHTRKVAENKAKYGYTDWYDWKVDHWGTKWDVYDKDPTRVMVMADDGKTAKLTFDSAWSPPVGFYANMHTQDFHIDAYYWEPGIGFCGTWHDGDDTYYDIPKTAAEAETSIPKKLDEMFGISKSMAAWEAEAAEDAKDTEE